MGDKIKSVLSVHIYSQRKKLVLFVHNVRISINLFAKRHPESHKTMRPATV